LKQIDEIMNDKLKNPNTLFDAESMATHISIVTSKSGDIKGGKPGSNSSKGPKGSKMKTSQGGMKESKNESDATSSVSGSM